MRGRLFLLWSIFSSLTALGSSSKCPSPNNESFLLQRGRSYRYRYRSEALTQAVGTTDDQGRVLLECDVILHPDRPCFHHLHLEECRLTAEGGRPGSQAAWINQQPLPALSAYPVSFSLENGRIHMVKFHEEDPLHFVNIKRGVLSAFVFRMSQTQGEVKENHTDVQGTCPMSSRPGAEPSTVVTSKDMLHCHLPSRHDWQFSPWSLFWNMSFVQHVINSTNDCTYRVDIGKRRLEDVKCRERHAFMIMSSQRTANSVQTNVNYHLTFVSKEQAPNPWSGRVPLVRKSGIQFEYEDTPEHLSSPPLFLAKAQKMLSDLVLDSVDEVRLSTIPQFTDLVAWLRSAHDLVPLVDSVHACAFLPEEVFCDEKIKDVSISLLSDALLQCNSMPCIKALTHLATQDHRYLDVAHQSWSYMHHAEPSFISNFEALCNDTKSHQCWLSLGSYVRRVTDPSLKPYRYTVGREAMKMADFFRFRIRELCDSNEKDSEALPDCLIFLKAAGNMGQFYGRLSVNELLDLAKNSNSPVVVRASALQTLKEVSDIDNRLQRDIIYNQLLPLLKNESLATIVRILAYDQIIAASEDHQFAEHLLGILKDEKNVEVRHYVASNLDTFMADKDFRAKRWKLFYTLNKLLWDNNLSLEKILQETEGRSRSSSNGAFLDLSFLPDSMRRFGLKIRDTLLYDSPVQPSVVSLETVLQLFSSMLPPTKLGGYFEGFEELLQSFQQNLREMDSKPPTANKVYEALMRTLNEIGKDVLKSGSLHNFDQDVLSSLKKLHQLYWQHHSKREPFARAYLDLFGSTIKYFTLDNLQSGSVNQDLAAMMQSVMPKLAEGATYSRTGVVRLIEGYHQVPTMMGLPLNWTTNATLAFSVKAGLKCDATGKNSLVQVSAFLEPSAALTFLNRMVIDFPTVTQIGVQANSSGYSSTQLRAQVDYSEGKQSLRFERPSKTQKVLQLFHTNQLIKHNRYEEIEDRDLERTSLSWCSREGGGLKLCLSKSYPNVTYRIKPWALMAGWCKLELLLHPTSQNSVHYDLELLQPTDGGAKKNKYKAQVSVTDNDKDKYTYLRATTGKNRKAETMELKTPLSPDFSFLLSKSDLIAEKEVSGHKLEANLQLTKDFAYRLEISREDKVLKSRAETSSSSDDDCLTETMHKEKVSLTTPYGAYSWNQTSKTFEENVDFEAYASYENLGGESNWLKNTLPPSFWEDDTRASMEVRLQWETPGCGNEDPVKRRAEFVLKTPRHTMTLNAIDRFDAWLNYKTTFNLARTDIRRGKLDAFLNLTIHSWTTTSEPFHAQKVVNLTIPGRSWEASFKRILDGFSRWQHEAKLRRVLMIPTEKSDYVGWWSEEVGDLFRLEEQEIKLTADNSLTDSMSTEDLLDKYSTLRAEDLQESSEHGLLSSYFAFTYPFMGRTESFIYDGYIIQSRNRYQMNFDWTSSYHDLKLTSRTVYGESLTKNGFTIDHSSHFTHLGTGTRAHNTMLINVEQNGRCYPGTFHHETRWHVLDMTSDIDWSCQWEPEKDPLYTRRVTLQTNSSMWNTLDMKLEEIMEDVSSKQYREEMTVTHASGQMRLDAEWNADPNHYQQRIVFCSKDGNCPNAKITHDDFTKDKRMRVQFALPNRNDTQVKYDRKTSSDSKRLHITVTHQDQQDGLSDVLYFTGDILDRHFHVWRGMLNATSYAKVVDLVSPVYAAYSRVAKDEEHPLNKILRPTLKMSLHDYWNGLKKQMGEFLATSWNEVFEVFDVVETFTEPLYTMFVNVFDNTKGWCGAAYKYLKEKTATVWTFDYLRLPQYFKEGLSKFPLTLKGLVHQLSLGEENILYFKQVTGNLLSLESFRELPYIDLLPLLQKGRAFLTPSPPYTPWATKREKLALMFGSRHLYTFDGHLYDGPYHQHHEKDRPYGGCAYLLAHDVRSSLFTVLSTTSALVILFPETIVAIDDYNRVYVDGNPHSTELPFQSSNGKVTVRRSGVVEVWSPSLSVLCRSQDSLCVLRLSEYHSGGVIGLLGNADGNPNNDLMLPDGSVPSSLRDFIRAYEVSGNASCRTASFPRVPPPYEEAQMSCRPVIQYLCPRMPRLQEQFVKACASDILDGRSNCHAHAALAAICHLQHEPTHTECGSARWPHRIWSECSSSTGDSGDPRRIGCSLEVVLLVQQSKHLSEGDNNSTVEGIQSLITAINQKFKDRYKVVMFTVVGYGGTGVHAPPSIHALDENVWLESDYAGTEGLMKLEFNSREEADGLQALKFAVEEVGHDTFDSKLFVVIAAKDELVSDKKLVNHLQQQMEVNGVTLYVISSYPSMEKDNIRVFGMRADGVTIPTQAENAHLELPAGNLAKLAFSTRGSVFLSKYLMDNEPQAFFEQFTQEVWSKVNEETEKCRKCRFVRNNWWWYTNECRIVPC